MKYLVALVAVVALAGLVTRKPALRRAFHLVLGLLALYAVLKMTGVIEALVPARDGVY